MYVYVFGLFLNSGFILETGPTNAPIQAVRNPLHNSQIYRCGRILFSSHPVRECNVFINNCLTERFA